MSVLAIVPARKNSKGVPGKNFRIISPDGHSPAELAIMCAVEAGCDRVVYSSDWPLTSYAGPRIDVVPRPPALAQDDTPMIDVVKHVLSEIPGPPDQIIVLLQPTQPLRTPAHVRAAIALLQGSEADSVVSVVEVPRALHPELLCEMTDELRPWRWWCECGSEWDAMPSTRQAVSRPAFYRDGTVYAFRRFVAKRFHNIYGHDVRPLIIDPADTCALDTPEDWAEAERRLRSR